MLDLDSRWEIVFLPYFYAFYKNLIASKMIRDKPDNFINSL